MRKRILMAAAAVLFMAASVSAYEYSYEDDDDGRFFGGAAGFGVSAIGFAPVINLYAGCIDLEASCAIARNVEQNMLTLGPEASLGYASNPFGVYFSSVGLAYKIKMDLNVNDTSESLFMHGAGAYFSANLRFGRKFGFSVKTYLPFIVFNTGKKNNIEFTIVDGNGGFWEAFAVGFLATTVSAKIYF